MNDSTINICSQNRLHYLDCAKGFGILLIVLGHICNSKVDFKDYLAIWINSFHLPIFFIIAGILISYKDEKQGTLKSIFVKKLKSLMYPYMTFSFLYLVYFVFKQIINHNPVLVDVLQLIVSIVNLSGISTLWFLSALFIGEIVFLFIIKQWSSLTSIIILIVLTAFAFFLGDYCDRYSTSISLIDQAKYTFMYIVARSLIAASFIGIGYYYTQNERLFLLTPNVKVLICFCFFICNIYISTFHVSINLRVAYLNNPFLYMLTGTIGSISVLGIFEYFKNMRFFSYMGRNSLIIMVTHLPFPVIGCATKLLAYFGIIDSSFSCIYVYVFAIFSVACLLEVLIIEAINRFFPWMVKIPSLSKLNAYYRSVLSG